MNSPGFLHMVYFWLRDEGDARQREHIAQGCHEYLSGIPGVLRLTVGFPAHTPRDIVDNSYGVALLVEFADAQAHDIYQEHPDHLRFIEVCGPSWSRVQVYDSISRPG